MKKGGCIRERKREREGGRSLCIFAVSMCVCVCLGEPRVTVFRLEEEGRCLSVLERKRDRRKKFHKFLLSVCV